MSASGISRPCAGRVDVWRVSVPTESGRLAWHWARIDCDERARASCFRFAPDRARFVIGRSTIRDLLARVLGLDAGKIGFGATPLGKRFLACADSTVQFNTSHSGDWVLHAVTDIDPVGIDVEAVRPGLARIEEFESVLAPEEFQSLQTVPDEDRARAFATAWARKEAYVKALGEGVGRGLGRIAIGARADGVPVLLRDDNPGGQPQAWSVRDLDVGHAHAASLVVRRAAVSVVVTDYAPTVAPPVADRASGADS